MALCTQSDVEDVLQFTFTDNSDPVIASYIAAADAFLKRWLNRNIEAQDFQNLVVAPTNSSLVLPDFPILELDVTENDIALTVGDDFVVEPGGVVRRITETGSYRRWDPLVGRVVVSCRVGYETVPADLTQACALMAGGMFQRGKVSDAGGAPVASKQIDDFSITYDTGRLQMVAADSFQSSGAQALAMGYRRTLDGPLPSTWEQPGAFTP